MKEEEEGAGEPSGAGHLRYTAVGRCSWRRHTIVGRCSWRRRRDGPSYGGMAGWGLKLGVGATLGPIQYGNKSGGLGGLYSRPS
jgi:hypothetical protein